ncbi:MAG: hypothetical protein M1830_002507 [Pleopsidium flavum]|nr:MAG: hypothetical protein M1830_002507 [Pleopsidium flavum]
MNRLKTQQRERKKAESNGRAFVQGNNASSISSSDEEDLDALEEEQGQSQGGGEGKQRGKFGRGFHDIKEPKDKIMAWVGGDREREDRETEDDVGAMKGRERRAEGGGAQAGPR